MVLIGRLTKDVNLRETQDGNYVTSFNLAVDKKLSKDKRVEFESRGIPTADFPRITVWGTIAKNCKKFLSKGRKVAVKGRIQTGSYEKDGQRVYTTDVVAEQVEFLEWGEKASKDDYAGFEPYDDDIPF